MADSKSFFLSLGSNIKSRSSYMKTALQKIKDHEGIEIILESRLMDNPALLETGQNDFLNQVIHGICHLSPWKLLDFLQQVERETGRIKRFKNGPREIDLDILCYDKIQLKNDRLQLPHPGLYDRPYLHTLLNELDAGFCTTPKPGIYLNKNHGIRIQ